MDEQTPVPAAPEPIVLPPASPVGPSKQTSTTAVISLVAGILGWSLAPWLGSIVAIITGHMARREIARNPDTMDGDVMAVIGLVLGWSMMIFSILGIIMVILFFGGLVGLLAIVGVAGH
ncbi:DUF4190 domain-containing protein [Arenimonas oryziterrae]|uniref:DUF4190 domain-containing protein n=1 Tax=Arenimonas oryziterrae DSM 21050 = YC6267 TaxID=1121015 RepID=A0A091AZ69_9GAMM|nr:DUF4190 domain-containing protein [Arenimonas oryziterrae]KFN44597.1 hypothetical protein N789_00900 [Arenimonas oryziterrae DSM 21050 = YC6267]